MTNNILKKTLVSTTAISLAASLFAGLTSVEVANAQDSYFSPFSWSEATKEEAADYDLAKANVQLKHDGLIVQPRLNVSANNGSLTASRNEPVTFQAFWNYGSFIETAEVRIFSVQDNVKSEPLKVIALTDSLSETRNDFDALPDDVIYVLRVYDTKGRFDETQAKPLTFIDNGFDQDVDTVNPSQLIGYGIDRTAVRNISIKGSTVTVIGSDVAQGGQVVVLGRTVPVDTNGKFAVEHILPYGEHTIDVDVSRGQEVVKIKRDIYLDKSEFFYVAIGDVTLGTGGTAGPASFYVQDDEDFDDVAVYGRGAMYMKGRVNGDYLVTGAIDTGEERLQDIFKNLDQKDPRQLLRRLDGDRLYPVYGDDSTLVEDAPTQGRFYLRVEKDDSHIQWGNFATQITGTEFAHLDRGLYGAIGDYNSQDVTSFGERKTQVTGFAADPGTIPAFEEYRATGGSVYFLNRQDLSIGSERVRVEIRDKVSGLVIETRELRAQEDYDVDYIQGRILLSSALQSTVSDTQVVRDGALSGNDVFVIVRYEYTPTLSDVDGYTIGGRATHWFGDNFRLGATAQKETTDAADQDLLGFDAVLRRSEGTYIKGEIAQTEGPGVSQSRSTDGGFIFDTIEAQGQVNQKAQAYRVEGAADLNEFSGVTGKLHGYYDYQEDGFSGTNRLAIGGVERWGAGVSADITDRSSASFQYDEIASEGSGTNKAVYGELDYSLGQKLELSAAIRHDERETISTDVNPAVDGSRTDGSMQIQSQLNDRVSMFAFGQATLDRDASRQRNNRFGIGGDIKLNDRLSVNGEVSEGDGGFGANIQGTYQRSDNSQYYLGYALSADRTDTGFATSSQSLANSGILTFGAKTRFSDSLSVYGEERIGYSPNQTALTHVYGLTFNPSEVWSFGVNVENGQIDDDINGTFDRTAFALTAGHATESIRLASNLEARFEDGLLSGTQRDRTTWLMRNTVSIDTSENWEMLGRFNFAISDSDQSDFLNADFVEGVVGAAYRPIANDRLNALLKYTYFEDLSPAQQISSGSQTALPRQRSEILSVDGIYDLTEKLSIGGKYGYRSGEVSFDRTSDDYIRSNAHLAVVRLDYHVVKKWDILAEGRWLSSSLAENEQYGALLGLYRHIGDNAKIGAGYSFSKFSDDLTDFETDNDGFFINLIGKF